MATIRLCDWTKERLAKDEATILVVVGEHEFEVGVAGSAALLEQLEGEGAPDVRMQIVEVPQATIPPTPAPPPTPGLPLADAIGLDVPATGDPFAATPGQTPPAQATAGLSEDAPPVQVPENVNERLAAPSIATADRVIAESTRFEEGGLPALSMGGEAHRVAMRRLRALEAKEESKLKRGLPKGVQINPQPGE